MCNFPTDKGFFFPSSPLFSSSFFIPLLLLSTLCLHCLQWFVLCSFGLGRQWVWKQWGRAASTGTLKKRCTGGLTRVRRTGARGRCVRCGHHLVAWGQERVWAWRLESDLTARDQVSWRMRWMRGNASFLTHILTSETHTIACCLLYKPLIYMLVSALGPAQWITDTALWEPLWGPLGSIYFDSRRFPTGVCVTTDEHLFEDPSKNLWFVMV